MRKRIAEFLTLRGGVLCALVAVAVLGTAGCSRVGLLQDEAPDVERIVTRLPSEGLAANPEIIVYADNRPGWRLKNMFLARESWLTWKQLILGVYQIYLLGEGVVGGVNAIRRVPDYGEKQAVWARDAIYDQAKRSNVDFIVNLGDVATDGRRPRDWETFLRQYREEVPVVDDFPYLVSVGNHERTNDPAYGRPNFETVFGHPFFYAVHCPDVDFFVTDSNVLLDQYGYIDDAVQERLIEKWFLSADPSHPSWLERELAASDKAFKVVMMHHPPIAFAKHYPNWNNTGSGPELASKRRRLLELFAREGVQVVFAGHQHNYEHSIVRRGSGAGQDVHVVITGGAGSPLHRSVGEKTIAERQAAFAAQDLDVVMVRQEAIYNYCLVDVTAERLEIRVFEVSGDPERNGRLVDTLTIEGRTAGAGS